MSCPVQVCSRLDHRLAARDNGHTATRNGTYALGREPTPSPGAIGSHTTESKRDAGSPVGPDGPRRRAGDLLKIGVNSNSQNAYSHDRRRLDSDRSISLKRVRVGPCSPPGAARLRESVLAGTVGLHRVSRGHLFATRDPAAVSPVLAVRVLADRRTAGRCCQTVAWLEHRRDGTP